MNLFRKFKKLFAGLDFISEYFRFRKLSRAGGKERLEMRWADIYPFLRERTSITYFDHHYIYHPAWAARVVAQIKPVKHVDISSSLTFCTMISAFVPTDFYDYRPANLSLSGLECNHGDLMQLPFPNSSVPSLSCMHVVEHIGLGRYGEPIDPDGDLKAIAELKRVLASGGSLLFVTPVGRPRLRFNAHRIYSADQIHSYFQGLLVKQFVLIDDHGHYLPDCGMEYVDRQNYGCGCWWFTKP
jgi:SAM-dependent methyltransferase